MKASNLKTAMVLETLRQKIVTVKEQVGKYHTLLVDPINQTVAVPLGNALVYMISDPSLAEQLMLVTRAALEREEESLRLELGDLGVYTFDDE